MPECVDCRCFLVFRPFSLRDLGELGLLSGQSQRRIFLYRVIYNGSETSLLSVRFLPMILIGFFGCTP